MITEAIIMEGVTEYAEGMDVSLSTRNGRLTIDAKNEGGHNGTDVDLVQLLLWVQKNLPELLQRPWVGLTDEDVNRESAMITSQMKLAFHAGMYVAQKILKEKNDH